MKREQIYGFHKVLISQFKSQGVRLEPRSPKFKPCPATNLYDNPEFITVNLYSLSEQRLRTGTSLFPTHTPMEILCIEVAVLSESYFQTEGYFH